MRIGISNTPIDRYSDDTFPQQEEPGPAVCQVTHNATRTHLLSEGSVAFLPELGDRSSSKETLKGWGSSESISMSTVSAGRAHWTSAPHLYENDNNDLLNMVTLLRMLATLW